MAKRRLISLLPNALQTPDLSNFFGCTIDEVFQPGTAESISGFIGRRPSNVDPLDFYIGEPSASRAAYQLEAGMVSFDPTGTLTKALTYADFIGYLDTSGAEVDDHQRLFETDYYSFSPPINIDMLVNYRSYYWFGNNLSVPHLTAANAASGATLLALSSVAGIGIGQSVSGAGIAAGTLVTAINSSTITLGLPTTAAISSGANVNIGGLPILILTVPLTIATGDGATTTYDLPASIAAVPVGNETPAVYVDNLPVTFTVVGTTVVLAVAPANGTTVMVARVPSLIEAVAGDTTVDVSDLNSDGVTALSSGMCIKVIDALYILGGWDVAPWENITWDLDANGIYMVDGIGLSVRFTADEDLLRGIEAQYVTIDRSSREENLWSLHNLWVHKDTFAWADLPAEALAGRQATRPIVEFVRDLVMWSDAAALASNASLASTTLTFTRALPALTGRQVFGPHIASDTLVQSVNGNTLTLSKPTAGSILSGTMITFRQQWGESTRDPLFMLYDLHDVAINDPVVYPGSNFVGNRIFGFSAGSAPIDRVLHRSLAFDANDYILFDNATVLTGWSAVNPQAKYTYSGGDITGLYQYATTDTTTVYDALWHPAEATTSQGITNGFFDIPRNLEANPSSEDVTTISRSTWIDHFQTIIANQLDLVGNTLGINNYRDTARDLTLGTHILQHRAPMLKAMLLAADNSLDLPQAIRFVDQEYNRFRHKFARKLVDLRNRGVLLDADPATTWVTTTLKTLKRDKNNLFPFALNTIAGGNYFIPPTPTCLGIMPAAVPSMVTDTTYTAPVLMILGHDGSLTPAFNDWRDPIMLALEQAIYDNLPTQFKTEARPVFDIQQWIGGRFYSPYTGYTRDEVSGIVAPLFELWAQQNHLDYRSNKSFDFGNPFTWNYRGVRDRDNNPLPGNWRAIYRWYYGTDAPHLRPWEMLGFVSEPTWWQTTYGAPPYASTNTALWTDLENGTIAGGLRAGTDSIYARPGLSDLIPVDASGHLLDPVAVGIVLTTVTPDTAARSWLVSDEGPVENLWRNSASYRFALAIAGFLMKPARFVEECWDTLNIGYIGQQWVVLDTMARPLNAALTVHGESRTMITGISQWISDFLRLGGHDSTTFGDAVHGLDVRLIHKMAGFTSSDDMQVVAENFGLVPSENVTTMLYISPNTRSEVYSGVILEWTGRSWRVIGYDTRNPFFTVIPPDPNGPKGLISLSDVVEPHIVKWRPNVYFPAGILVEYLNSVWQCLRGHTSAPQFEQDFWKPRPDVNPAQVQAPRVITYQRGLDTTTRVTYGDELYTFQQVADFLLGWQRWLESRGWLFNVVDANGQLLNWSLAVREFLSWAQVQWAPGNFIALSPGQQQLNFNSPTGTILNVESQTNAFFGLSDRSGRPIGARDASVNRLDGDINIQARDADIFCARLGFSDIEHALVLSNVTLFDDDIYLPIFDMRQTRLRLICKRSRDWAGRLDAPGFVVIGNQLKSDFEKAAEDVRLMFDIELADRVSLRDYARHVIGFQKRDYLENLLLSDIEQLEFYQGLIQQKGAPGVFRKLIRSNRASNNSDLQFLEEWAIRIGEFGAPLDPFMIFELSQLDTRDDPQLVRLVPISNPSPDWIVLALGDTRWVDPPVHPDSFFALHRDYAAAALPTAGPVRLSDVSQTVFHIADVPALYTSLMQDGITPFATGSSTWVYERDDGTYTVLRSFETGTVANAILKVVTKAEDGTVTTTRIYFQRSITLTTADVGNFLVIDGLSLSVPELQGLVTITAVNTGSHYVDIDLIGTSGKDFTSSLSLAPLVRVLREVRFPNQSALLAAGYTFAVNDIVWLDNYLGQWGVLQWNGTTWSAIRRQPLRADPTSISETVVYSAGTKLINRQMIIDEPVIDDLMVIDPLDNLIAGIADREIDFKTDYDPARYNAGIGFAANPWGLQQVGRVWWNLATVKFLDPYTDTLGVSNARDLTELAYRTANWSHIAPNTSVDVYEWIESTVAPAAYNGPGTVYNSDNPSWAEHSLFDTTLGKFTTLYFFWVTGLAVTPNVAFRHTDIGTVALAIANPSGLDIAWMAPIDKDALIVSGVSQFLDDTSTVMKVKLTLDRDSAGRHNEWSLLRAADETSLPSVQMWQKLRDSLAGFDTLLRPIPAPDLSPMRATGVREPQSLFAYNDSQGIGTGLLAARQSFVGIINTIFNRSPFMRDRLTLTGTLNRSTPIDQYLIWAQLDPSFVFEPPPRNEWDVEVFALDQRNRLLARSDFQAALTSGKKLRVLFNGYSNPLKQWSIWEFDPAEANVLIGAHPFDPVPELLVSNADLVFSLALSYEYSVLDMTTRDALAENGGYGIGLFGTGAYSAVNGVPLNSGDRVLVTNDTDFWSIWKYLPGDPNADSAGFVLWRAQTYRTNDFISQIDWYASSGPNGEAAYTAMNPPVVSYATVTDRNLTEGTLPINQFVRIDDNGAGHWVWTQFDTTANEWVTVAVQSGTLALSSGLYAPGKAIHGVEVWKPTIAATLAGGSTLTLGDVAGIGVGQFVIGDQFDRSTRVLSISGNVLTLDTAATTDVAIGSKIAFTTLSLADIATRDGAWELYVLADALRYGGLLVDAESNEIFFSILNFVHTQQDSLDWAFKTSFMTIVGYDVPLQQTPVLLSDQTASLLSYVNEVKPYHVKVRAFSTQYKTDVDIANAQLVEDRAFNLTMLFDRYTVDAWDVVGWDDDAWDSGDRIPPDFWLIADHRIANETRRWESTAWDTDLWDSDLGNYGWIFVHTVVTTSLTADGPVIEVDDISALRSLYVEDTFTPVSGSNPVTIRIGANLYQIASVDEDAINVSTKTDGGANYILSADAHSGDTTLSLSVTAGIVVNQSVFGPNITDGALVTAVTANTIEISLPISGDLAASTSITVAVGNVVGISGTLTTLSGNIMAADGIAGNVIEAIIAMPDSAQRIIDHYQPSVGLPANDLTMLLNLDRPSFVTYTLSADALNGATTLALSATTGIIVNQPIFGPNIVRGTLITAVTTDMIEISLPIIGDILANVSVTVGLPVWIDGDGLASSIPSYTYDGVTLAPTPTANVSLNPPLASRPGGFDLREPYENDQPEERVPFQADDCLHLLVTTDDDRAQWMTNSRLPALLRMPPARDVTGAQIIGAPNNSDAPAQPMYQVLDEYVTISDFNTGTLGADLSPDASTITVNLDPLTSGSIDQPFSVPRGSLWIGSERIEYRGYSRRGGHGALSNVVIFSQLRRGTRGTSIAEQRSVVFSTGTGSAQAQIFSGTGTVDVMVNGVSHAFTEEVISGNTSITLTAPLGAYVAIGFTGGYVYSSGMTVYNGDAFVTPPVPLEPVSAKPMSVVAHSHAGRLT